MFNMCFLNTSYFYFKIFLNELYPWPVCNSCVLVAFLYNGWVKDHFIYNSSSITCKDFLLTPYLIYRPVVDHDLGLDEGAARPLHLLQLIVRQVLIMRIIPTFFKTISGIFVLQFLFLQFFTLIIRYFLMRRGCFCTLKLHIWNLKVSNSKSHPKLSPRLKYHSGIGNN